MLPSLRNKIITYILIVTTLVVFVFSCVVTLSDAQGAIIFVLTVPIMFVLLALAYYIIRNQSFHLRIVKIIAIGLGAFFISSFIPILNKGPEFILNMTGKTFEKIVGKSPYVYFKERSSFTNKLKIEIEKASSNKSRAEIDFAKIDVTFAWDKVCIFGPYTNNKKAREVLKLDWDIETRSEIYYSDSINSLVFLFENKVNNVVDLSRGVVDFQDLDVCLNRNESRFELLLDADNRRIFKILN